MSVFSKGFSVAGKLLLVVLLGSAFIFGMGGVMYLSLQGKEVKVPEITGKDFAASQNELESLGLRIKRRADRYSEEPAGTVLEQLPKPGETVKSGQMIFVVVSKSNPEGEDKPATIKKDDDKGDAEKIEELISEKPKKKNSNSNSNVNSASNLSKKEGEAAGGGASGDGGNTAPAKTPASGAERDKDKQEGKPTASPGKPNSAAPKSEARPAAETRPRRVP